MTFTFLPSKSQLAEGIPARLRPFIPMLPYGLAFSMGALSVSGWAPLAWWMIAVAAYGFLFQSLCRSVSMSSALLRGFAFGAGLHLVGHGWIFPALHDKAGLGFVASVLSTAFYLSYLAAFTALPCAFYVFFIRRFPASAERLWCHCLIYAGLLTLGEWARTLFFNGFTSLSLGYSLLDTWLAGYGPIAGVYGMSWAGLCIASMMSALRAPKGPDKRGQCRCMNGVLFVASFGIVFGGWLAQHVNWTQPVGQPVSYRLIQANIRQSVKFDPRMVQQHARRIAESILQEPADVIVTPETAFPMFLNELPPDLLPRLQAFAKHTRSNIFLGVATCAANTDGYNSLLQLGPDMEQGQIARYDKSRLMPFGEYTPVGFTWFTRLLSIPLKDLSAGAAGQHPFSISQPLSAIKIGTLICHEDLIGNEARMRAQSTNLLFNPSNLSWFDGTLAVSQRMQIVRMRALEVGRPILRVANTGVTAHIDAKGRVVSELQPGIDRILTGKVWPTQGVTLYTQYGDALTLCVALLSIFLPVLLLRSGQC